MECRVGTNLFGHSGGVDGGTVRVFLPVWLCCGCYGTLEMVGGWSVFIAFFAVSFLGGLMSAVGFLCYIRRFLSVNLWFFRAVLCLKVIDFQ